MNVKEMQQSLENESDGNELYDLLIDYGKNIHGHFRRKMI